MLLNIKFQIEWPFNIDATEQSLPRRCSLLAFHPLWEIMVLHIAEGAQRVHCPVQLGVYILLKGLVACWP